MLLVALILEKNVSEKGAGPSDCGIEHQHK